MCPDKPSIFPQPELSGLTCPVEGVDQTGQQVALPIINERPLTLFLNTQEIVTLMTVGDWPELLAIGYLCNQNMLRRDDQITAIDYDQVINTVIVRTAHQTDFEVKLKKKIRTSGCGQGTVFADVMDRFEAIELNKNARLKTSWLYSLTKQINQMPSLYLTAGAVHGSVLCDEDRPLVFMEDVGRHNAVDKIAGWMWQNNISATDKIFYTTGRLTSEIVVKAALMEIPILISRSGFTSWGVELARQVGLTLIGRARGQRFLALSGAERIIYDADLKEISAEHPRHQRKAAR